jgi:hypothetical protein
MKSENAISRQRESSTMDDHLTSPLINGETTMKNETLDRKAPSDRDPISGALGAHPVGTGVGAAAGGFAGAAAAGAVAGAVTGTTVGPLGTAIGAVIGAVAGGLAGKGVAELIDPTAEDAYWRVNYSNRPYVARDGSYDDYGPAYRYGVDGYEQYNGRPFDEVEPELSRDWERAKGSSRLTWADAKHAARDSWQRVSDAVERAVPGDSDRDGK